MDVEARARKIAEDHAILNELRAKELLARNGLSPEDAADRSRYLLSHDIQQDLGGSKHTLIIARVIDSLEYEITAPTIRYVP